jgi:hypothetical protein
VGLAQLKQNGNEYAADVIATMGALNLAERGDPLPAIEIRRLALTNDDVEDGDLPSFDADTKRGDPRWRWFVQQYGARCWELDALSPVALRERVAAAIRTCVDEATWQRSRAAEEAEAESLQTVLANWNGGH